MTTPHKHAKLIKAWADGAEIQFRRAEYLNWHDCRNNNPQWVLDVEYRVKPVPRCCVPYRRYLYQTKDVYVVVVHYKHDLKTQSNPEDLSHFHSWIDNDWITHELP